MRIVRRSTAIALLTGVVALLACAEPPEEPDAAAVERAETTVRKLAADLMQHLQTEMKSGGPAGAVRVCSEVALDLAAQHSVDGVTVRRVSLKPRNPADAPDDWERERLIELEALHQAGDLPLHVTDTFADQDGKRLRYLKPILVNEACLRCHGPEASIDPDVRTVLAERYPDDPATGYADGDLRGAFSVSVPLD